MHREVNLTKKILTDAGPRYCPVVLSNNGRVKPDYVTVDGREERVWRMGPSPDRWRERSRTLPGIAAAMAEQWGGDMAL